ncbi:MAG: NADH:flavin oxidoreductase/NADH oxidase, partial [Terracidiphilus sp.]
MGHPLFSPFKIRSVEFANRVGVSPMCEYSSEDGFANDWHMVHLGCRAQGGAALVMTEATAVLPEGRISPADLGIWKDEHIPMLRRIAAFLHSQGARAGLQLAHAGRKGSMTPPFLPEKLVTLEGGGWQPVGPSEIAFAPHYGVPRVLDEDGIAAVIEGFRQAAWRALEAGFDVVEIHGAHGYLLHEFLSPLANQRTDRFGGGFENRTRLTMEVAKAVRGVWPEELPLFVRISATDWAEGGWSVDDSVELARRLRGCGVDLVDVSSGGMVPHAKIPAAPG